MDGAAIAAGIGGTITIDGRVFTVRARDLEFYAQVEAEIVKLRGNPMELIVQAAQRLKAEPDSARLIDVVANAVSNRFRNWRLASYSDYGEFYDTPYGEAFQLWCCIKHNPNCPTPQEIRKWMFDRLNREGDLQAIRDEINSLVNRAGSEDTLGNSTGPSQSSVPAQAAGTVTG